MSEQTKKQFFDAVDVVCLNCEFASEKACKDCPVRRTVNSFNPKKALAAEIRDQIQSCVNDKSNLSDGEWLDVFIALAEKTAKLLEEEGGD